MLLCLRRRDGASTSPEPVGHISTFSTSCITIWNYYREGGRDVNLLSRHFAYNELAFGTGLAGIVDRVEDDTGYLANASGRLHISVLVDYVEEMNKIAGDAEALWRDALSEHVEDSQPFKTHGPRGASPHTSAARRPKSHRLCAY